MTLSSWAVWAHLKYTWSDRLFFLSWNSFHINTVFQMTKMNRGHTSPAAIISPVDSTQYEEQIDSLPRSLCSLNQKHSPPQLGSLCWLSLPLQPPTLWAPISSFPSVPVTQCSVPAQTPCTCWSPWSPHCCFLTSSSLLHSQDSISRKIWLPTIGRLRGAVS